MSFSRLGCLAAVTVLLATTLAAPAHASSRIKTLNAPGCKWIGTRVVQSLVRDDIIAANEYNAMYKSMACPARKLILAFSCTVKGISTPEPQTTTQFSGAKTSEDGQSTHTEVLPRADQAHVTQTVIHACWDNPRAK